MPVHYIRKIREVREYYEVYHTHQEKASMQWVERDGNFVSAHPIGKPTKTILEDFRLLTEPEQAIFTSRDE